MTNPEPKPLSHQKRSNSWKKAVVYDPANHILCTEAEETLADSAKIEKIRLPKFGSRMDIYVDEDGLKDKKSLVATVNLDRLGWLVNMRRHIGSISHLYVMELSGRPHTPVVAAAA